MQARMEITVQKRQGRTVPTQPVSIECTEKGFAPENVTCIFSQPLFFVIKAPTRINIWVEKADPAERKYDRRRIPLRQKGVA
jgi:hypothetical protein